MKSYKEKIKGLMDREITDSIKIIKKVSEKELYDFMKMSFLVVNPSICLEEDFGLSMVEALSQGIPVIASDWGGIKDIIRNGQDGFLIKTYFKENNLIGLDTGQMVGSIDKLLSDKVSYKRLSCNALMRYQENFSKRVFLANMNTLLKDLGKQTEKDALILRPKMKYKAAYESSLKNKSVENIYLDHPWLFKELYTHYLSN
jgi:glycosyltransferase involved in cell wall biosynthesis